MTSASGEKSWSQGIRRHVFQLVTLLISLLVIGSSYVIWSHETLESLERQANNFHLAVSSHYLRAIDNLRRIQAHHRLTGITKGLTRDPPRTFGLLLDDASHLSLHHLVRQEIRKGLELEQAHANREFSLLTDRLARQLERVDRALENRLRPLADGQASLPDVSPLLTTLEQLVRLHSITRERLLREHEQRAARQNTLFFGLAGILAIIGLLIARRSLRAVNWLALKQRAVEEKIKHQAHYDALTGLPNRYLALDRLTLMTRDAGRNQQHVGVLFIDLDFFKKVNDMFGHARGDRLLVEAARRIARSVRGSDTVGRLGGDEFIVLVGGVDSADEIGPIAENLIASLRDPFSIDGNELVLTASIGISVYPEDGSDRHQLIRKADTAMYHAKNSGRNAFSYFTESMNRITSRQLGLEGQLHGALDRGEFEVYYQQKVEIESGRIVGAEALLRWNSEVLGPVSPAEFIPIAEQSGLIVQLGEFVLAEALNATHAWRREAGTDFRIAVNLSPRQFRDPDLVNHISKSLHRAGVPSEGLELEITEGVLLNDYLDIDDDLAELTRLGVVIAMDDFGTGYSSLSYLRHYPFSVIKIDRSLIQGIDDSAMNEQLVNAAISMAHALNIEVVAEGVETGPQLDILRRLGCDIAQGFYFGRPLPRAKITERLRTQRNPDGAQNVVDIDALRDQPSRVR